MSALLPNWRIALNERPRAALIAVGIHGPNLTQRFRSERHWWLHLYRYAATLRVDGVALALRPGYATLLPPGVELEYAFRERSMHLCAHFTLPEAADGIHVPALRDFGDHFPAYYRALEEAAACLALHPMRAEVRLWDLLWQWTDPLPLQDVPVHPHPAPVVRACQLIELHLGEPLSVKALAEEVGVSHNHLTRLFHAALGETVIGYLRRRRVERARHLLEHTTLPIKTIAAQVGIEDPRQFYRLMQTMLGRSPSEVRSGARSG